MKICYESVNLSMFVQVSSPLNIIYREIPRDPVTHAARTPTDKYVRGIT